MDCKYRIKKNDWDNKFKPKKEGNIKENIRYKIIDFDSIILHITDIEFKKEIEKIVSKYRKKKILYEQFFIDKVINNYDNSYYIFLFNNNNIIGMTRAGVRSKKVEISMVYLLPEFRRKNYAYYMLNNFITFLKEQKDVIKIGLSVEKDNIRAFNLYKKLNFEIECIKDEELLENLELVKYSMIYMFLK